MSMSLAVRSWALVVMLSVSLTNQLHAATASDSEDSRFVDAVSRLYGRYAWVALFSTSSPPGSVPLARSGRSDLLDVFAPDIAQAIWEDSQCAAKHREICTLDFDILFDSQDPSASELTVLRGETEDVAQACFREFSGARKCLNFIGKKVGGRMRVVDIVYPEQRSLRRLLGLP